MLDELIQKPLEQSRSAINSIGHRLNERNRGPHMYLRVVIHQDSLISAVSDMIVETQKEELND